ncbi:MAG: hypothetical protein R3F62_10535 [Planctomycetota bacterium]
MHALRERLVAYELDARPDLARFHPREVRASLLRAWLDVELGRIGDRAFAEGFARACPRNDAPPEAYWPRVLEGTPTLLAGIRFKGGDRAQPFVELIAWDGPLPAWDALRQRLAAAFAQFAPRRLRLRLPGEAPPPGSAVELDQWLVAGRVAELRRQPRSAALATRSAADLACFEAFCAAYRAWQAGAGPLGAEVQPASREELEACLESGAVVLVEAEGAWAGLAAAERQAERGLRGFCVVEELLDAPLRGQGRAAALQRALIDALPAEEDDVLWGTIHGINAPSLRTARRVGREVVEGWWFVGLA